MEQIIEIKEKNESGVINKCVCEHDFLTRNSNKIYCSECSKIKRREYIRKWGAKNKEEINIRRRKWKKNNPEKVKDQSRRDYLKYRDAIITRVKKYQRDNPDRTKESYNQWRRNNPEKVRLMKKSWNLRNPEKVKSMKARDYINNKERVILYQKGYQKERRNNDSDFYIKEKIRHRLLLAFNNYSKFGKVRKSDEYGIDYKSIIKHLGLCPGNRKDYHIDHIIPISKFNFDDTEQVRLAFSPENHQWLLAKDNMRKSNKVLVTIPKTKTGESDDR